MFGPKWRFLHVVRDGRDVAFGSDHRQFDELCDVMYGSEVCEAALMRTRPPANKAAAAASSGSGAASGAVAVVQEETEKEGREAGEKAEAEEEEEAAAVRKAVLVLEWWSDVNLQAYKWAKAHLTDKR